MGHCLRTAQQESHARLSIMKRTSHHTVPNQDLAEMTRIAS